jgi:hypothetical protein
MYCTIQPILLKQHCHAIKLRCKATYFYTLVCTEAHPWMHAYGDSHTLNKMTAWEYSGMQRSKHASMLYCMYISYPVLIYTLISCTMLLLFFILPTIYHFYDAHFPQPYNHICLWNPLALLLLQPHKFTMLVLSNRDLVTEIHGNR